MKKINSGAGGGGGGEGWRRVERGGVFTDKVEHGCDFYEMAHVKAARSNVGLPTRD